MTAAEQVRRDTTKSGWAGLSYLLQKFNLNLRLAMPMRAHRHWHHRHHWHRQYHTRAVDSDAPVR